MQINNPFYYLYAPNAKGELERIDTVDGSMLKEWFKNEGIKYSTLRMVKNTGHYADIQRLKGNKWDVTDRGIESLELHEKYTFKDHTKKKKNTTDDRIKRAEKDKPLDQQKHHLKVDRGTNRKRQSYVPLYRQMQHNDTLPTAQTVLTNAKKSNSGIWKVSKRQVVEIASKYKFNIPTIKKRTKHLGSTGILMWRKNADEYYLVKFSKHIKNKKL